MPDDRWYKFRHEYTTKEHLLSIHEALTERSPNSNLPTPVVSTESLERFRDAVSGDLERVSDHLMGLGDIVGDGFRQVGMALDWGFSEVLLRLDAQIELQQRTRALLRNPRKTRSNEDAIDAERCIRDRLWAEAVDYLRSTIKMNRLDYRAHFQLASVLWFQFGNFDEAWEHFRLAVRYSDRPTSTPLEKQFAAVANAHLSLLSRLDGSKPSLSKALDYAERGYHVSSESCLGVGEYLIILCHLGHWERVATVLTETLKEHEEFLTPLRANSELRRFPEFQNYLQEWTTFHIAQLKVLLDSFPDFLSGQFAASTHSECGGPREVILKALAELSRNAESRLSNAARDCHFIEQELGTLHDRLLAHLKDDLGELESSRDVVFAVIFGGMVVLGMAIELIIRVLGHDQLSPAWILTVSAVVVVVPIVLHIVRRVQNSRNLRIGLECKLQSAIDTKNSLTLEQERLNTAMASVHAALDTYSTPYPHR